MCLLVFSLIIWGFLGVESAALIGQEKNQMEVVGVGIDSDELIRRLTENVVPAELIIQYDLYDYVKGIQKG